MAVQLPACLPVQQLLAWLSGQMPLLPQLSLALALMLTFALPL